MTVWTQIIFLSIWVIIATLQTVYRLTFQYKEVGEKPIAYKQVKKILSVAEIISLCFIGTMANTVNYWYVVLIPFAFTLRFFINFLAFRRESNKLYDFYIQKKIGETPQDALELANFQINSDIEQRIRN